MPCTAMAVLKVVVGINAAKKPEGQVLPWKSQVSDEPGEHTALCIVFFLTSRVEALLLLHASSPTTAEAPKV